ncbi:hypothetical protein [Actinoplanes sp. NPDC049118]|uniref:hypothetical protein n=1 Tax=Actinoplanes sp. NPDC049118 TaxID=3155769 RepID=UPI0033C04CFC
MRVFTHKSVRFAVGLPAAIAVSAGIGLSATAVDAAASPRVAASPASAARTSHAEQPGRLSKRLLDALLTKSDLPAGFATLTDPAKADPSTVDACNKPIKPAPDGKPADSVQVMFMKEKDNTVLFESLTATGDKAARAVVADYADAPRRCRAITLDKGDDEIRMTQFPLRVPRLGDAATGIRFVMKMKEPETTMHGKMVVVASGDISATIMVLGLTKPDQGEVEKIAAAAVEKLKPKE